MTASSGVDFVVQIHSVLAVRYGAGWAKMWQGLDMEFVRADWRRVLRDFEHNPTAVAHALDNLPVGPRPPTVGEFLQLCESAPRPAVRLLAREGTRPSPQQQAIMEMMRTQVVTTGGGASVRDRALQGWQRNLQRIEAGEVVSPTIRRWTLEMAARNGVRVGQRHAH